MYCNYSNCNKWNNKPRKGHIWLNSNYRTFTKSPSSTITYSNSIFIPFCLYTVTVHVFSKYCAIVRNVEKQMVIHVTHFQVVVLSWKKQKYHNLFEFSVSIGIFLCPITIHSNIQVLCNCQENVENGMVH